MGLIVGVTLVSAGVILFVMLPLFRGDWAPLERSEDEVTEVDARKQAALRGLRDAEYDYRSGKIDQEDYKLLKSDLGRQALQALEEENAAAPGTDADVVTSASKSQAKGSSSKRSKRDKRVPATTGGDDLEAEIARVRKGLAEGRTCAACGHLNVAKSRFCTTCGGSLALETASAGEAASG